ncbi:cytochrome P450 [Methylocapsa polymorpha]|uniref:Cytochrome P450 n=1 Tax=Methylocapsa polymorpha TaxID=3080828 RepID=A0ABZ0HMF3_9HYPH|nr:cytochrome P450 [Methylocapsa sp. RX1]
MANVSTQGAAPEDRPQPPGPKGLPFLGNGLQLKRDPLGFLTDCARTYGDVVRISLPGQAGFLISHPNDIEKTLVAGAQNFVKTSGGQQSRPASRRREQDLMTWVRNFPSDGEAWLPEKELAHPSHRERRQIQPAFHSERIEAYAETMVALTQRSLATWKDGEIRNAHVDMTHLALVVIAKTLFSADAGGEAKKLADAFSTIIAQIVSQMVNPIQIPNFIPTPHNLRLRKAIAQIDGFLEALVRQHRANQDINDLISILLKAQDESDGAVSANDWRYQAMTVFVAGYETTALTLTWALYLISENPDVEAKLAAELNAVLAGQPPRAADVPKLRYTEMIVKETLRLYPPVWLLGPRTCIEDFEVGGYRLPAGSTILISPWVTQRDPRNFEHPQIFDPDRWADESMKQTPKFAYFPFSGGERQCIGKSYAMMEAVLVLATIAQSWRLKLAPGARVEPQPLVTLQPRFGMPMKIAAR